MSEYVKRLEHIAKVHLEKSPAHLVDNKVLAFDRERMLSFVKGPKVLEMGCGDGDWTPKMIELFGHSYVVDASKTLLANVCEANPGAVTPFLSLFEEFEPPGGMRFNTVVATHVLEHVDDPIKVLKKAKTWLAADGSVLIMVPNATSIHRQLAVLMGIQKTVYDFSPRDLEVGHQRVYDLPHLRSDISAAGLEITFERGLFLKVLPNGMMTGFPDGLIQALGHISDSMPAELMANLAVVARPR